MNEKIPPRPEYQAIQRDDGHQAGSLGTRTRGRLIPEEDQPVGAKGRSGGVNGFID